MSEDKNIIISDEKIEEFIKANDKRKVTVLEKYKDLIIRLLDCEISKKKIYEFIYENDKEIGTRINFYKYIERNIESPKQKKEVKTKPLNKQTETALKPTETIKEDNELVKVNKTATSKLSDDFDLLADVEMGSLKK